MAVFNRNLMTYMYLADVKLSYRMCGATSFKLAPHPTQLRHSKPNVKA